MVVRRILSPSTILLSFVIIALHIHLAHAANWYVNDTSTVGDGYTTTTGADTQAGTASAPFRTIIKAVANASAGDTIFVDAGIYDSYVKIKYGLFETAAIDITKDSLTLVGKDSVSTVIDMSRYYSTYPLQVFGIFADSQTGLMIRNLGIRGAIYNILFHNVKNSRISGDSICGQSRYSHGIVTSHLTGPGAIPPIETHLFCRF